MRRASPLLLRGAFLRHLPGESLPLSASSYLIARNSVSLEFERTSGGEEIKPSAPKVWRRLRGGALFE